MTAELIRPSQRTRKGRAPQGCKTLLVGKVERLRHPPFAVSD